MELAQLRGFPEAGRGDLIRYFTLTTAEDTFVRKFRGQGKVLGAAVQLCTLPWLGFVPDEVASAAVARLGPELRGYGAREQTRTDHLREIITFQGWRTIDGRGAGPLSEEKPGDPPTLPS